MKYHCEVCGREIPREEYESQEGMCSNCFEEFIQQYDEELDELEEE